MDPRLTIYGLSIPVLTASTEFIAHMAIVLPENISGSNIVVKNAAGFDTVPVIVSFRYKGKKAFEDPMQYMVVSDGTQQEVRYDFPDTAMRKSIEAIQISYAQLRTLAKTRITVDDIKIIGSNDSSPTPVPTCHYEEVQCVAAPCDPILVCDTPTPTP